MLENAAFLRHLAATGNAREAARLCDVNRSRFTRRRAANPLFAARWDVALVMAQASLSKKASLSETPALGRRAASAHPRRPESEREPVIVRRRDGTVQIRRRLPTAISPAAIQRFLLALAATANVRLSARAAGFAHSRFYSRKRGDPAFARQWRDALAMGYERVTYALMAGMLDDEHEHDSWAHNEPLPVPPMTANQALQLLYLHQKEARALEPPEPLRCRPGESSEARNVRLTLLYRASQDRERAKFEDGEAARRARGDPPYWGGDWPAPHESPRPDMPDLAQVTGWSRADPKKAVYDETRALFGGRRIGDGQGTS